MLIQRNILIKYEINQIRATYNGPFTPIEDSVSKMKEEAANGWPIKVEWD
jgi:hypothetical protein